MDLTDSTKERKTSKEEKAKEMEDKPKNEKKKEVTIFLLLDTLNVKREVRIIHPGLALVRLFKVEYILQHEKGQLHH